MNYMNSEPEPSKKKTRRPYRPPKQWETGSKSEAKETPLKLEKKKLHGHVSKDILYSKVATGCRPVFNEPGLTVTPRVIQEVSQPGMLINVEKTTMTLEDIEGK